MIIGSVLGALTEQPIGVIAGGLIGALAGNYFEKESLRKK